MLRRSLLALLGGAAVVPAAAAQDAAQRWFIQVWFQGEFPIEADPANDPGRIEVSMAGEFVACAWAPVYRSRQGQFFLVPLTLGATAAGRREDVKVEVYGELKRLARPTVKVTAVTV